jgi:hypothetical protein
MSGDYRRATENVDVIALCCEKNASEKTVLDSVIDELVHLATNGFECFYSPWNMKVLVKVYPFFFPADSPQHNTLCWYVYYYYYY